MLDHKAVGIAPDLLQHKEKVLSFVLAQYQRMPDFLKLPFGILTFCFNFWGLVTGGRFFIYLSASQQKKQIQAWQSSSLKISRDFIKFYESLVIFSGCSYV
ncbi:hypothetical protein K4A83_11770 [Spirulina subsalsa FACHB-351]|uniref:Transposase n=1 Tax=Spirulina subsalsa FACHB-351 TaxID=234711 RepID=A0ABT3L611_9CYAN|nr:hypothetical protein [Spirulina subsalsa]MCW6036936.1 hypothetical protein [Spirulina subsalsa FACHB-351]